jgi:hypothetical protein
VGKVTEKGLERKRSIPRLKFDDGLLNELGEVRVLCAKHEKEVCAKHDRNSFDG